MASGLQNIDAPCPGCKYNLRGRIKLGGCTECPECGSTWRIDQLMLQQYAVPRFRWTYLCWALLPGAIFSAVMALHEVLYGTPLESTMNAVFPFLSVIVICLGPVVIAILCWGAFETIKDTYRAPVAVLASLVMIALNVALALTVASMI